MLDLEVQREMEVRVDFFVLLFKKLS